MHHKIEELAELSVARGCGFAALGIATFMVALSGEMSLALKAGGILVLVACLVLIARAIQARQHPYKRTEVWLMLKPGDRPQPSAAQEIIGSILRDVYLRYASLSAGVSAAMLSGSVLLAALRMPLVP